LQNEYNLENIAYSLHGLHNKLNKLHAMTVDCKPTRGLLKHQRFSAFVDIFILLLSYKTRLHFVFWNIYYTYDAKTRNEANPDA